MVTYDNFCNFFFNKFKKKTHLHNDTRVRFKIIRNQWRGIVMMGGGSKYVCLKSCEHHEPPLMQPHDAHLHFHRLPSFHESIYKKKKLTTYRTCIHIIPRCVRIVATAVAAMTYYTSV